MKSLQEIARDQDAMATIVQLTNAFEGLASMRIAQIKNQVLQAQQFFEQLWHIYSQIRVDSLFRFGRAESEQYTQKELFIVITGEGGFSGDIDQKLIATMLEHYAPAKQDIVVIGHHGALLLAQNHTSFKKYFKLPSRDQNINVEPLVQIIRQYRNTSVFYQTYETLMNQTIKRIELSLFVQAQTRKTVVDTEIISESNYIFEPSSFEVIAHLERSMMQVTLSQLILDSKLAQYASRFRAMSVANDRADESLTDLKRLFNRSKRAIHDERLKEMVNGLKKARAL